jgi:hypothetical protein
MRVLVASEFIDFLESNGFGKYSRRGVPDPYILSFKNVLELLEKAFMNDKFVFETTLTILRGMNLKKDKKAEIFDMNEA